MKLGFSFREIFLLDLELFMLDISIWNMGEHGFGLMDEKLMIFIYGYNLSEIQLMVLG